MASLTRLLRADIGSSLLVSASWQMNRRRVRAWRAEPAWIVVNPLTPDDSVRSSGSASLSRTSPTIATSGAMRRKPATSRRRSTAGRSARAARVCIPATLASGTSASNTSSAITTRLAGSSSAAQHDSSVVLPDPGAPAKTIESPARTASVRKAGHGRARHVARHQLVERVERDAGEPTDVDDEVTTTGDVAVDDVQARAVVELRVLQTLGRVELAVAHRGVVEDLGERAGDVLVVVEDLVVVARPALVPLHQDHVGGVDHDLPHVGVVEQRGQRPVAGDVAEGPLGHERRLGQLEGPDPALGVVGPPFDLVADQRPQTFVALGARQVEGQILGPRLDPLLDLDEGVEIGHGQLVGGRAGGGVHGVGI